VVTDSSNERCIHCHEWDEREFREAAHTLLFRFSLYLQPFFIESMWPKGQIALDDFKSGSKDFMKQLSRHEKVLLAMHYLSDAVGFISETLLADSEDVPDVPRNRLLNEDRDSAKDISPASVMYHEVPEVMEPQVRGRK
jgi:hypothetical protein